MRRIFIGDVHGMLPELQSLLAKVSPLPSEEIVFVGDLVDKGPDSVGVVSFVRNLPGAVLVKGNHEAKHQRFRRQVAEGRDVSQKKGWEALQEISNTLTPEDIVFLDGALPYYKTGNYLVVHAGVPGTMHSFPPPPKGMELLYYTRFVNKTTGKMIPLGQNTPEDPFWAEVYDGRFGHVVFGHQPYMEGPALFPHATGIDTGACFGGTLTALAIHEDGTREFISVPGRKFATLYGSEE